MRLLAFLLLVLPPLASEPKNFVVPQLPPWQQMGRASGMVFSGVVLQVQRSATATGTTQVTFRVENAIRGVRRGQLVRIREWGGLWNNGERYASGERVLLFLYPQSKLGLTSPVGGRLGRFAVDPAGRVLVDSPQLHAVRPVPLRTVRAQITKAAKE